MPFSKKLPKRGDPNRWESESTENDDSDWETDPESDDSDREADPESDDTGGLVHTSITMPTLLPIATSIAKPNDKLCDTCTALELTPSRFVVLPTDSDSEQSDTYDGDDSDELDETPIGDYDPDEADGEDIQLGPVKDIKDRSKLCPLCRLVLRAISIDELPNVEDGDPIVVTLRWRTDGENPDPEEPWNYRPIPQVRVLIPRLKKQSGGQLYFKGADFSSEITLLANDAPTPTKSYLARLIDDQINFDMVHNWLQMCSEAHGDYCDHSKILSQKISNPSAEIPSFRVIDVVDNCVVLAPHDCKYVALSYVWGNINTLSLLRLLRENVAELQTPGSLLKKENIDRIPRTIRDAMQVVREIHLRYLWTDSLCIIQDDDGDKGSKQDAISKMDLVYGAAHLTIIAAAGKDANVGLPGVRLGTRGISQAVEELAPGFRLVQKSKSMDYYFRSSVYNTRGWTFQESMFASRKLRFIGGQVEYICRNGGDGWREDMVLEDRYSESNPLAVVGVPDEILHDYIGEYESPLEAYSGLSLKFDTDIYHAFAGMTRFFRNELKVNLCHGIPDKLFDWFLLWKPSGPQTRRVNTPSWSWSGWTGGSMWTISRWYGLDVLEIRRALRERTWVIWYQRTAHDSEECTRVLNTNTDGNSTARGARNFYGGQVQDRFPFDCTQTVPTSRKLMTAPTYVKDSYHPHPGSGFLQFWTVSVRFKLGESNSEEDELPPESRYSRRLGIFGKEDREVGIVYVHPTWCENRVLKVHDFILICEARERDIRSAKDREREQGWRYMVMLIEWHGEWAERIAVGWIKRRHLTRALNDGPVWKEIILG